MSEMIGIVASWGWTVTTVGRDVPIPPKRPHNAMNVGTSLRADEDIGPYQLLRPQHCDNTDFLDTGHRTTDSGQRPGRMPITFAGMDALTDAGLVCYTVNHELNK